MSIRQGVRVGFMGAGGTGKTTTAQFISEKTGLTLPMSASREIYEKFELSEEKVQTEFSDDKKLALQLDIFDLKIGRDQEFSYVTDRTLLDHFCYCLAYCGGFMEDDQFLEFEEKTRTRMLSTYSHLFYFPWGYWTPESDGVRQDRMSWQSQIDALMAGYIIRWNLPVIQVPQTEGEDVRNEFVLKHILGEEK